MGIGSAWRLAVRVVPPSDVCRSVNSEVLGIWRNISFARRSRSEFRVAALEQRQAITQ